MLLAFLSASRVSQITFLRMDYLTKPVYTSAASPFDEDLPERQKAPPQCEVLQFLRWQQTLCIHGN